MKVIYLLLSVLVLAIPACKKKPESTNPPKEISILSGDNQKGFPYEYLIDTIIIKVVPEKKSDMMKYSYRLDNGDFNSKASYIMYTPVNEMIFKVLWKLSGENSQQLTFGVYTDLAGVSPYECQCEPVASVTMRATFKLPWQVVYHEPITFRDMHFFDLNEGITTGDFNGFYTTHDGGATWSLKNISGFSSYKLSFSSRDTGLAVSRFNMAKFTFDGGQTFISAVDWTQPRSDFQMNDYLMLNPNNIFAVGLEGNIFKTTNGGKTWKKGTGYTFSGYLRSITATKNNNIFTCGDMGEVLKSSDMGETWEVKGQPTYQDLKILYFYDNNLGFAGGKLGTLIRSTDGGENWKAVNTGLKFDIIGIYFASPKTGFIVTYAGEIARTRDGGLTWKLVCYDSYEAWDVTKVCFQDTVSVFGLENGMIKKFNMRD